MVSRLVSLVLIAAVIACPLWCGVGVCRGKSDADRAEASPARRPACCCCRHESPASDDEDPSPSPSDHTPCQGVCGGAVIEKVDPSFVLSDHFSVWLVAFEPTATTSEIRPTHFRSDQGHHSGVNSGRMLRTLQMSWRC